MGRDHDKVAATTGTGPGTSTDAREEALAHQNKLAFGKERAEEKPQASEEIVIEEISIDGMCGVY